MQMYSDCEGFPLLYGIVWVGNIIIMTPVFFGVVAPTKTAVFLPPLNSQATTISTLDLRRKGSRSNDGNRKVKWGNRGEICAKQYKQ